ncbi:hypothetical protein JHK85_033273 [Glycine max]|nr:hypothetical protein JHK85_033273 [Glycine max]
MPCSQAENGFVNSFSLFPEKVVQELLQSPVQGSDDHLIEFSEALRTVAKALRLVAEGKASAQAEAAEWKRKYELERDRNLKFEHAEKSCIEHQAEHEDVRTNNPAKQPVLCNEANGQSEKCCSRNGICSHEVLRDGTPGSDSKMVKKMVEPAKESTHLCGTTRQDKELLRLHTKVDLVVTLGGDGTVLWAASMFKGPVPPIVPFSLGSLGFMTPFSELNHPSDSEQYKECLESILKGPISITLRHRLQCHVIRDAAKNEYETEEPILVLNEVTIDRGISSFLTNLECYCDNSFVTCVQGDGLILSTTSGSTAYSLAAGGSMVHPQVPGILFTPICPHSLSFRPLIFPEHVTLRVQVPFNSRSPAWASFDGKDRKQLAPGDALVCSMAPWPVPTACLDDSTNDFLRSIHEGLHWNLRKTQSFDGPRET